MRIFAAAKPGCAGHRRGYQFPLDYFKLRRRSLLLALVLCALGPVPIRGQDTHQEETDRLATLLNWHPGSVVAEIGAGDGKLTLLAASKFVGTTGKLYSTELDAKKLAHLEELAAKEKSIITLRAAETETNLPRECCDSIFMRLVYHHLTKPAEVDASLFRSLKPGGLLAVIDQDRGREPRLRWVCPRTALDTACRKRS
jgi:ubiquinone/menaquinone biosynthesis C-methylase UbiE